MNGALCKCIVEYRYPTWSTLLIDQGAAHPSQPRLETHALQENANHNVEVRVRIRYPLWRLSNLRYPWNGGSI
jgi:hypothetical protein